MMWFNKAAHMWATKENNNEPGKAELPDDLDLCDSIDDVHSMWYIS